MKRVLIFALILSGCAGVRHVAELPAARVSVELAGASLKAASGDAMAAKVAVAAARETASPAQQPLLEQAATAVEGTLRHLSLAGAALEEAVRRVTLLQAEAQALREDVARLDAARLREEAQAAFWRGVAWKLAALAAALGLWMLREPLWKGVLAMGRLAV